jgi:oligopeptide/dipeptide ABC transporter ATP-binding protein
MTEVDQGNIAVTPAGKPPLLTIDNLVVEFTSRQGETFRATDGVAFSIDAGEVVALVGESGSGKSVTARSILKLIPHPGRIVSGKIMFQGRDVMRMSKQRVRQLRGQQVGMVFQDPMASLNPVLRVGDQIGEAISLHSSGRATGLRARVRDLLGRVGITRPAERARSYPHEFSGGMRQRAMIAMGLANNPALLIADEPTTALDVTIQDQIIELLRDLNANLGTSILLITHNLALVASLCSRVLVMYAGRIVEEAPMAQIFDAPQHPYTWLLLRSIPRLDSVEGERLTAIEGQPPNPRNLPSGCKFHPRCPFAIERCSIEEPPLAEIAPGHKARCWVLMRNAVIAPAKEPA